MKAALGQLSRLGHSFERDPSQQGEVSQSMRMAAPVGTGAGREPSLNKAFLGSFPDPIT